MINAIGGTAHYSSISQTENRHVRSEDCKSHNVYSFCYDSNNDGLYPSRLNGEPKYLSPSEVGKFSLWIPTEENGVALDFHSAEKFFSTDISPAERKSFYDSTMEVREFHENDRRYVFSLARQQAEKHLVGQLSVFSKVDVSAGKCIGVYAGEVVNNDNIYKFSEHDINTYSMEFHMRSGSEKNETIIVGDGAISRINGIFEYDEARGWHEAESGFNVCVEGVPAELNNGDEVLFPCYFAISDIKPGEELRVLYGYNDQAVSEIMSRYGSPNQHHQ